MSMKNRVDRSIDDPWETLGVPVVGTDEEIRTAYLAKVREYPPDRAEEFERIRDAYAILRDPRRRARYHLVAGTGDLDFTGLTRGRVSQRRFVGTQFWMEVLKGK